MSAIDTDLLAMRDQLIAALHDHLQGALEIHTITGAVDVAIDKAGVRTLVETAATGSAAIIAYSAAYPTPPPTVTAAVGTFNGSAAGARDFYPGAIP